MEYLHFRNGMICGRTSQGHDKQEIFVEYLHLSEWYVGASARVTADRSFSWSTHLYRALKIGTWRPVVS